jgi:four helix bundle protein
VQDFRKLEVWQKSHLLAIDTYRLTEAFPKDELYNLTSQIHRASISIPSNIAEGCGRGGGIELGRFLQIAFGSACELEYQLLLANDLKFLNGKDYEGVNKQIVDVKRMLTSLIKKVKN